MLKWIHFRLSLAPVRSLHWHWEPPRPVPEPEARVESTVSKSQRMDDLHDKPIVFICQKKYVIIIRWQLLTNGSPFMNVLICLSNSAIVSVKPAELSLSPFDHPPEYNFTSSMLVASDWRVPGWWCRRLAINQRIKCEGQFLGKSLGIFAV